MFPRKFDKNAAYDVASVKNHDVLFTDYRIDHKSVRNAGYYPYDLRHGDDDSYPVTVEESVFVNFFGCVITDKPFEFDNPYDKHIMLDYEDFYFEDIKRTPKEFF